MKGWGICIMTNHDDTPLDTVRGLFDTAAAKTGEAIQASKLHLEKARIKNELNELYTELGKAHFCAETGEQPMDTDPMLQMVEQIRQKRAEYEDVCTRIGASKYVPCPFCGRKNAPKNLYCTDCGAPI